MLPTARVRDKLGTNGLRVRHATCEILYLDFFKSLHLDIVTYITVRYGVEKTFLNTEAI